MARQLDQTIADAAARNRSLAETLESLVDFELESRNCRSIERRFRLSHLHAQHSIDSFHFKHHKSRLDLKPRILRLLDLEFIAKGAAAIFIGNPGVGKTFLAKIIGWRACQANQRVLFTTAMDMLNHLLASQVDHSLIRKLRIYTEPTLLIVDELGYLSLDQQSSNLFYQVISTRHSQKRSTIITTNTAFSDWATSSTTPPLPPPSPTVWSRTPKSSCSAVTVFARAMADRIRRPPPNSGAPAATMRRAVMITRVEESAG
jgi:DNA replication protein DnaC